MKCNEIDINPANPIVMGILNATPDSFYNQGRESSIDELVNSAGKMIDEGATILDIGGQSSRPNAALIPVNEESSRVLPVLKMIRAEFPRVLLSVDTFHSEVARVCLENGANIINDISGGNMDDAMMDIVAQYKAPYVCMHMKGTPQTMQQQAAYDNVVMDVYDFFAAKLERLHTKGVDDVMLDVGFGFGKTLEHNYQLLSTMSTFLALNKPLLAGISRKSMVYKLLHSSAEQALNGTTALHMIALQQGASILRVHDVKEAMECIILHKKLTESGKTLSSD
ncbi:MAG: dihydropteroate synthase [Chitinophagaceae bacterium]|nr:dihydropteroate synthase [Chitinophagaceae bacterium]